MLRVEIGWYTGWTSMEYDTFQLGSEAKKYELSVTGYHGDTIDIFPHQLTPYSFYTFDRDDGNSDATKQHGALWATSGTATSNLNGQMDFPGSTPLQRHIGPVYPEDRDAFTPG